MQVHVGRGHDDKHLVLLRDLPAVDGDVASNLKAVISQVWRLLQRMPLDEPLATPGDTVAHEPLYPAAFVDVHVRRHRHAVPVEQAELELGIGVDAVAVVEVQVDGYPASVIGSAAVREVVDGPAAASQAEGAGR